jgi:hypothetical protein
LQAELRIDQLAPGERYQFRIFALDVRHPYLGQTFQPRAKGAFRPPGSPRSSTQFPLVARKKAHDQIGFLIGVSAQDEGVAHPRGHSFDAKH